MELALVRSLMNKEFYDEYRGVQCPDNLFSKDVRKIKCALDAAIARYDRTVTPDEMEALFMVDNPSMTTAQKETYREVFNKLKQEKPLGVDVAQEVLSKLFQQFIGEEIANIGFDCVNGTLTSLEPLRQLLEKYTDDFMPNVRVEWDDISLENIIAQNSLETHWKFNIPSLQKKIEGVSAGHLIEVGARSNTGKTSFHASIVASPGGFASQGAKCMVLCNEESSARVVMRYVAACTNVDKDEVCARPDLVIDEYKKITDHIFFKDVTGRNMAWVDSVCKSYKPDIVILDMGDKFASAQGQARMDEVLKANVIHARQIAKRHNCAIFYMSQLSAEAEGKVTLNQAMMEGSKTGKAAEADLMILIAKNPAIEGEDERSAQRHLNIVKNKLSGWHGMIHCTLDTKTARYTA